MAEAVFPHSGGGGVSTPTLPTTPSKTLPFFATASVVRRPDTVLVDDMPLSIWPSPGRLTASGVQYDHQAEAPLGFNSMLQEANLQVVSQGSIYVVVSCEPQAFLPHCVLLLRRMRSQGV